MVMDVTIWLGELGLAEYAKAFAENNVDAATLPWLTAEDLKDIGVTSVGHRRKLLEAIAALAEGDQEAHPHDAVKAESAPSGEYRQVTVLFADLAGFTRLSSELGAEETHTLLNRYFEAVDGIVAGYGGFVDKHMGDNVMAVFGAPTAHSDDPQRAVRAALDIHKVMVRLSEEFRRPLKAHVGIAMPAGPTRAAVLPTRPAPTAPTVSGVARNAGRRLSLALRGRMAARRRSH